jgi:L-alanine-DL-glutamate epimerase-like enolase superfamily enzyme
VSAWSQAPAIKSVEASAFTVPTEQPERDGTLEWSQTTLLLVVARAGDSTGIGYSYAHPAAAEVVSAKLAEIVCGQDPLQVGRAWAGMWRAVRNFGQTGLVSMAISAVDVALWDLKARLLDRALVDVVDAVRDTTPVYGSGDVTRCGGISGFLRVAAQVSCAWPRCVTPARWTCRRTAPRS